MDRNLPLLWVEKREDADADAGLERVWEACVRISSDFFCSARGKSIHRAQMAALLAPAREAAQNAGPDAVIAHETMYSHETIPTGNWPHYRMIDTGESGTQKRHTWWERADLDAHGNVIPMQSRGRIKVLKGPVWRDTHVKLNHFIATVSVHRRRTIEAE